MLVFQKLGILCQGDDGIARYSDVSQRHCGEEEQSSAPEARHIQKALDPVKSDDYLAALPEQQVAAWYGRLATHAVSGEGSLSATLLREWLSVHKPVDVVNIGTPATLLDAELTLESLKYHRRVYLTEEVARLDSGNRWAGLIPRLQGIGGFAKWNRQGTVAMEYQGLADGINPYKIVFLYKTGQLSREDSDLFTSLHGFQLKTTVELTVAPIADSSKLVVRFVSFTAQAFDRYDFDPKEHLTMPNPDYQSNAPDAVRPDLEKIRVYHTNAARLVAAGLAAPFNLTSDVWYPTDSAIAGKAKIDPNKSIS